MNTVGRKGRLGEQIRCVVSVSMLTEGWDTNTVTHILGVRAFGTQLLCEQVVGRGLRRHSYDLDPETGLSTSSTPTSWASTASTSPPRRSPPPARPRARPSTSTPSAPTATRWRSLFPRVEGYRVELPDERLDADFSKLEPYVLDPDKVGATRGHHAGHRRQPETITLEHLEGDAPLRARLQPRHATCSPTRSATPTSARSSTSSRQAQPSSRQWLDCGLLVCKGGTVPAQLCYRQLADEVCDLIAGADQHRSPSRRRRSSAPCSTPTTPRARPPHVNFTTSQTDRWQTAPRPLPHQLDRARQRLGGAARPGDRGPPPRRRLRQEPQPAASRSPTSTSGEPRRYLPDYLVRLDDGTTLVLEVKGFRGHDAALKAATTRDKWVPAVNRLGRFGRWAFGKYAEIHDFGPALDRAIIEACGETTA